MAAARAVTAADTSRSTKPSSCSARVVEPRTPSAGTARRKETASAVAPAKSTTLWRERLGGMSINARMWGKWGANAPATAGTPSYATPAAQAEWPTRPGRSSLPPPPSVVPAARDVSGPPSPSMGGSSPTVLTTSTPPGATTAATSASTGGVNRWSATPPPENTSSSTASYVSPAATARRT